MNIRWSPAEIAYALEESGTSVLFADDAFAEMATGLRDAVPGSLTLVHCGDGPLPDGMAAYEGLVAGSGPVPDTRTGGDALAGVFHTGGTTGFPKGVMLSHTNIAISALGSLAVDPYVTPGARFLHLLPMFHVAELALTMAGVEVGCTHEILASYDLSGLRHIVYGASPMPHSLLDRITRILPGAGFTQLYGMTELAPVATVLGPEDHAHPERRRSAGRAAPHAEVRVVGTDDRELPRGTVGEVVSRGDHVMLGYWSRTEETAEEIPAHVKTRIAGYKAPRDFTFVPELSPAGKVLKHELRRESRVRMRAEGGEA